MTTLAHIIATQRKKAGFSFWKLGNLTGLGITHLKRIEAGKPCRFSTALVILNALGVKAIQIQDFDLSR